MFEVVNEIAVLGTTFFMMAIAMIWYSSYLFEKPWLKSVGLNKGDLDFSQNRMKLRFVIGFLVYFVVIWNIAMAIGYAQMFDISVQKVAIALALSFATFMISLVIWEQRTFSYYFITVGFSTIFITGSSFILSYWPW